MLNRLLDAFMIIKDNVHPVENPLSPIKILASCLVAPSIVKKAAINASTHMSDKEMYA